MAQLKDKLMNRTIEGKLSLDSGDSVSNVVNPLIASAIQADKDILSKIVVTEHQETTIFTFPAKVMPLAFIEENVLGELLYVDYHNECLVASDGTLYAQTSVSINEDGCVEVRLNEENGEISNLLYINADIPLMSYFGSAYAILNPQPAGTKLYKHVVTINYNGSSVNPFMTIITDSSEPISLYEVPAYMGGGYGLDIKGKMIFSLDPKVFINSTNQGYCPRFASYSGTGYGIYYNKYNESTSTMSYDVNMFAGASSISVTHDIVTPL